MKIIDVEAIILRQPIVEMIGDGSQDTVVILVHTDTGITGIGEVDSSPYLVKEIIEMPSSHMVCMGLRDVIIGEDVFDVEKIWRKMYEKSLYYGRRSVAIHAMSGIDMAIWDAMGKKLGMPVCKLLGGAFRDRVRAYCSVLMPEDEKGINELVEKHMPKGYTGLKFGWGAFGQSYEKDIELVRAARRALGKEPYLLTDIGMVWTDVKRAIHTAKVFEESDVYLIEEPFSPDNLEAYYRLAHSVNTHISAGEEVGTLYEFVDLMDRGGIDIVQPDLSRCGGLSVARKLTDLAGMRNISIIPHAFKTNILLAATLQYIASLPNAWFLEYCEQDTILRQTLTDPIITIDQDGFVDIPMRPGIGVELNRDVVDKYRVG